MSRLGDLLRTERLRRKMTLKDVAKAGGVSEKYLQEVELGKRIIADDQARRILKKIGLTEHNETDFSLDDIAATVDLHTVAPAVAQPKKKPPEPAEAEVAYSDGEDKKNGSQSGVWLDALTSVLKRVPVYNAVMKEIDHKLLPVLDGRIEGASPEKVFYFCVPDDDLRGFRIQKDDLCLVVPSSSPIDGAVMLVDHGGRRALRKIRKLDALNVLLQSYDREYAAEPCALPDVSFVGRAVRVEISL